MDPTHLLNTCWTSTIPMWDMVFESTLPSPNIIFFGSNLSVDYCSTSSAQPLPWAKTSLMWCHCSIENPLALSRATMLYLVFYSHCSATASLRVHLVYREPLLQDVDFLVWGLFKPPYNTIYKTTYSHLYRYCY